MRTEHTSFDLGLRHGRGPLLGAALITLVLCGNALAQRIIGSGESYTYDVTTQITSLDPGYPASRTVIVETGGSLIFNARVNQDGGNSSAGPDNLTLPGRLILNGGTVTSAVDWKFPDGRGPVEIWLNAGTFTVNQLQHMGANTGNNNRRRPCIIWVGRGEMFVTARFGDGNNQWDPYQWVNHPDLVVDGVAYPCGLKGLPRYELKLEETGGQLRIYAVGPPPCAFTMEAVNSSLPVGGCGYVTVYAPDDVDSSQPVSVDLVSSDPSVAHPAGAPGGTLTVTFPANWTYPSTNIPISAVGAGQASFHLANPSAPACLGPTFTNADVTVSVAQLAITPSDTSVLVASSNGLVTVSIPTGLNCSGPVSVDVVSTDPAVAIPLGAVAGRLTLTFPAGGATSIVVPIDASAASIAGVTTFTLENPVTPGGAPVDLGGSSAMVAVNCYAVNLPAGAMAMVGQSKSITVTLTAGLNATQPTTFNLVSANPTVAVPQGAVSGVLPVTFAAGAPTTMDLAFDGLAPGSTLFQLTDANGQYCIDATAETLVSVHTPGATASKTEPFTDEASAASNGWVEFNSRANGQNFGFSASGNASGTPGEAGGTFVRRTDRQYYADTQIGYLTLNDHISASGQLIVTQPSTDATYNFGYFNTNDASGGRNILGVSLGEGNSAIPYPNSRIWASIGTAANVFVESVATVGIYPVTIHGWGIVYDPAGGPTGNGQLILTFTNSFDLTVTSVTNNLSAANRLVGASFNAFGLVQRGTSERAPEMLFYVDDLTYTKGFPLEVPELSRVEPGASGSTLKMTFTSASSLVGVQRTSVLDPPAWSRVPGVIFNSLGGNAWTAEFPKPDDSPVFYRVVVGQQ